eukprot:441000-Rhodomonas_salina.4
MSGVALAHYATPARTLAGTGIALLHRALVPKDRICCTMHNAAILLQRIDHTPSGAMTAYLPQYNCSVSAAALY